MENNMKNWSVGEASAFRAMGMNKSIPPNSPKCTYYQKLGHERSQCYKLVGYPSNWQGRRTNWPNNGRSRGSTGVRSNVGGRFDSKNMMQMWEDRSVMQRREEALLEMSYRRGGLHCDWARKSGKHGGRLWENYNTEHKAGRDTFQPF